MSERVFRIEMPDGPINVTADWYDVEGDFVIFSTINTATLVAADEPRRWWNTHAPYPMRTIDKTWVCTLRADRVLLIRRADPEPAAT